MSSQHFTIKVPCKKYVKAYLETNCGNPVDLRLMPDLQKKFIECLSRKPQHRENSDVAKYSEKVTIIIPSDTFYRHGWEMNKENELTFNRAIESMVKFMMRQYIGMTSALGNPVSNCIREFQEKFGFDESSWSYDSIKKDFDRHGKKVSLNTTRTLKKEIHKIFLDNLSELGTISKKTLKEKIYE